MEDRYFTVKEVSLNNRCPECYSNDGLRLTFKQKFVENRFYRAISNDLKHTLFCHNCNTEIFPIMWTDEFERVFEYHQKALVPKAATFKLQNITWVLLIALIVLIVLLNIYIFSN